MLIRWAVKDDKPAWTELAATPAGLFDSPAIPEEKSFRDYVNFEEIPFAYMAGFMADVQKTGKALRKISCAVKINYEIHSNSAPHIHCHLFPRYLDDDFPSAPIDYRVTEPSPYESEEEFLWFAGKMREELK